MEVERRGWTSFARVIANWETRRSINLRSRFAVARRQGNGWDEPYKPRGLRTVLWAAGGEIPPADPAVNREVHAPFCERPGVQFLRPTCHRCHYVIDWNFDEDRSRIRTGHGPENVSRLRRFAVGILHHFSDGKTSITKKWPT